jgi:ribosomal protein L37E
MEFGRRQMLLTPKALDPKAQSKRSAALGMRAHPTVSTLKGWDHRDVRCGCNAFGVKTGSRSRFPRVRCATLGFGMQRLRRKDRIAVSLPFPRVRCATLGFGMQRLRRKDRIAVSLPFPRVRCATLGFGMQRLRRKETPWLVACGNHPLYCDWHAPIWDRPTITGTRRHTPPSTNGLSTRG